MSLPTPPAPNGWKSGKDPTVRALRVITALVFVATIPMMVVLDRIDSGFATAIIIGLMLLLGILEGVVRLPDFMRSLIRFMDSQGDQGGDDDA